MNYPPPNNQSNPSTERNGMNNENMRIASNSRNGRNAYERRILLSGQPRQNTMSNNEVNGHDNILNGSTRNGGMSDPFRSSRNLNDNGNAANLLARLHILGSEGEVGPPVMSPENTSNSQLNGQFGYTNNTAGSVSLRGGSFNIHLRPDRGVNGGSFEPNPQTDQPSPLGRTGSSQMNGATNGINFEPPINGTYDEYLNRNIPPEISEYYYGNENMGNRPRTGLINHQTTQNAPSSMINRQIDHELSLRMNQNSQHSYIGSNQTDGPMNARNRTTLPNTTRTSGEDNETGTVYGAIVIKNIPFHVRKEQLRYLMEVELKLPVSYAFNYHFSDNQFRGIAFANYEFDSEAQSVIQAMNGRKVEGRVLQVQPKNKLPAGQREQAEREKRARRGQLLEQHQPIPDDQVRSLPSLSFEPNPPSTLVESIHSHDRIPPRQFTISPQATLPPRNLLPTLYY